MNEMQSLPQAARVSLRKKETGGAFNFRQNREWVSLSCTDFLHTCESLALGLHSIGVKKGDTIGIFARSSPYWLMTDIAILMAGGVSVPIFDDICDENLKFEINDSLIDFVYVDCDRCAKRLQALNLPNLKVIGRGLSKEFHGPRFRDFDRLVEAGSDILRHSPEKLDQLIECARPDEVATIIYTSGSSGRPKGVELTHRNLLSQFEASGKRFALNPSSDRAMSCLPLAHIFERMVVYFYLVSGISINFVDDIKQIGAYLKEVQPTTMTMVPRLLEKLYTRIRDNGLTAPFPRRQIARFALDQALERDPDRKREFLDQLLDKIVYSKIRDALGGRFERIIVGGSALPARLHQFFLNIGVPIYVGYGLTETSPVLAVNYPGKNRVGTVGPAMAGVELRLSDKGEILARGPNIMKGYHNQPEATAQTIDPEGWLHTGDLGKFDADGFLSIVGRSKELFKTSTGKYISPIPIEQALCESPLIDMAMVVAEGKPYACCLLFLDTLYIESELQIKASPETNDTVRTFVQAHIDKINERFNEWEHIRSFQLLGQAPSIEKKEITPTLKLVRHVVEAQNESLIKSMYSDHEHSSL